VPSALIQSLNPLIGDFINTIKQKQKSESRCPPRLSISCCVRAVQTKATRATQLGENRETGTSVEDFKFRSHCARHSGICFSFLFGV
jgi:hypothetical protein